MTQTLESCSEALFWLCPLQVTRLWASHSAPLFPHWCHMKGTQPRTAPKHCDGTRDGHTVTQWLLASFLLTLSKPSWDCISHHTHHSLSIDVFAFELCVFTAVEGSHLALVAF